MQFRVVVPAYAKPGQMLRIRCPDGTEGDVCIPKNLKPNNSFIFEMAADALLSNRNGGNGSSVYNQQQQQNSQKQQDGIQQRMTTPPTAIAVGVDLWKNEIASAGNRTKSRYPYNHGGVNGRTLTSSSSSARRYEYLAALTTGIFIGFSVITGFIFGVIISTSN